MNKLSQRIILFGALAQWLAAPVSVSGQSQPAAPPKPTARETVSPEQQVFFEKNIRTILVRECYSCHATTAQKVRGGLLLDSRDGIRKGGDNGPAVVPGDIKKSRLLMAIKQQHDELKMPPKKKLPAEVIADF